jgi:ribosomal protein S18 acetylase RimI-like enzyme
MLAMAAVPEAQAPDLVDLTQVGPYEIETMLEDEIRLWRKQLDWDFRPSADLVRRFVEIHALNGYALLAGGDAVGYVYFVCEEHKGLIGDLFIREKFRTPESERRLLAAVVDELMHTRGVRRIESQLMLAQPGLRRGMPAAGHVHAFERNFMVYDLAGESLRERPSDRVLFDHWSERRQDEAAYLIANAYRGHIDSEINDQYRSAEGARRFLFNIVQYPGCGTFFQPASWVALDRKGGRLCGISLTSMVAQEFGHVTQVCTSPAMRGTGVGYELLRRSLESLAGTRARKVSLTVTAANENAVALYEKMGFRVLKRFPAFVWEGF